MLAVLLIMTLSVTFTLVVVGAVHALATCESADVGAWKVAMLERQALERAAHALRWQSGDTSGGLQGDGGGGSWTAAWTSEPVVAGDAWPRVALYTTASAGRARLHRRRTLELRQEPWSSGVTCEHDAEFAAECTVSGSGVYVGGIIRDRQNLTFASADDYVHGDAVAPAAAHAAVGIFANGTEIHDQASSTAYPDDTDRHVGLVPPDDWYVPPTQEFLAAAEGAGMSADTAWSEGRLQLDELSAASPDEMVSGRCLVLPSTDEVAVRGELRPDAGRILLIVRGDAVIGAPGETMRLTGALLVAGHLDVRGPAIITGGLHAATLAVNAPLEVTVVPSWRWTPLTGTTRPTMIAMGE